MPMKCTPVMLLAALLVATCASAQGTPDRYIADEGLHAIVRHAGERRTPFTAAPPPAHPAAALSSGGRFLFVSRGMPQAELLAALDAAAADPRLTLVLRGLLPGETLNDAMQTLARLIGRRDPPPAIVIDPTLYRRHQVTVVPTLLDPATGSRREGAINAEDLAHADVPAADQHQPGARPRDPLPQPGHVEHDPEAIWSSQLATAREVLKSAKAAPGDVATIGVAGYTAPDGSVYWCQQFE